MIAGVGKRISAVASKWVPDPFVFALLLTLLTFVLAFGLGDKTAELSAGARLEALGKGWFADFYGTGLMKFALQMCIVLLTGHALAMSGPVRKGIDLLAGAVDSPRSAAAVVAVVACLASLVQWGLGAITGAFMAREMGRAFARRGKAVHYPLLGAAGYAGFLVWHGGLSGSAPLKVAEPGHFLEATIGVIPVSDTLFSPLNLAVTVTMLIVIPVFFFALMPTDEAEMVGFPGPTERDAAQADPAGDGRTAFVRLTEESWLLNGIVGSGLVAFLMAFFFEKGVAGWNLDSINLIFLALGILLHRSPASYVAAIVDGARGCAGIMLQFPFYFGILGLLKTSGLVAQIAHFFVAISSATTFPVLTFLSAGLVNFFVPSGGGQWAVQGPVVLEAVSQLGVAPQKAIMALAYGDAWTNMLQPFWALPLLGIMGLRARDIIGYTAFLMLVTGPLFMLLLFLF